MPKSSQPPAPARPLLFNSQDDPQSRSFESFHVARLAWPTAWNTAALFLLIRGLARQSADLPSWQIVIVAMLLIAISGIGRWLLLQDLKQSSDAGPAWSCRLALGFTPGAVVLTLWLCTLQPTLIAAVFIWLLVLVSEAFWIIQCCPWQIWARGQKRWNPFASETTVERKSAAGSGSPDPSAFDQVSAAGDEPPLAEDVDQRIERRVVDGADEVRGLLRVRYQPGQRIASVFAGFVPPLLPQPTAEAEAVWGSEASVSVADVHAQGIELELRRESVDDGEPSTIIEFYARGSNA